MRRVVVAGHLDADLTCHAGTLLVGDEDDEGVIDHFARIKRLRVNVIIVQMIFQIAGEFIHAERAVDALENSLLVLVVAGRFHLVAGRAIVRPCAVRRAVHAQGGAVIAILIRIQVQIRPSHSLGVDQRVNRLAQIPKRPIKITGICGGIRSVAT